MNELLTKDDIIKSLLDTQIALLGKLAEQKYEQNDQKHVILPNKSNKSGVKLLQIFYNNRKNNKIKLQ